MIQLMNATTAYAQNVAYGSPGESNFGFTVAACTGVVSIDKGGLLVRTAGVAKATAGAAIPVGATLGVNNAGRVIVYPGTGIPCGRAMTAAAADGNVIDVLIFRNGQQP